MKKFIKWFILITYPVFILTTIMFFYFLIEEHQRKISLRETQKQGIEIVAALNAYKQEQNSYPKKLDMLVPKYIKEIPLAPWGTSSWIYTNSDTNYFFLEVGYGDEEHLYPTMYYSSKHGWNLND